MNLKPALILALASLCASLALRAAPAQVRAALSARSTILRGASARPLFKQCSRSSPAADGFWNPGARDVAPLEASFTSFWRAQKRPARTPPLARCYRQYAGFTRGGRRMIYLNALGTCDDLQWKSRAVVVCDGGSSFFGAVYDVASRRWSTLSFNGPG